MFSKWPMAAILDLWVYKLLYLMVIGTLHTLKSMKYAFIDPQNPYKPYNISPYKLIYSKLSFSKWLMAAILDLRVKDISDYYNNIINGFLNLQNPLLHTLYSPKGLNYKFHIFQNGRWRPFWIFGSKKFRPPLEFRHPR